MENSFRTIHRRYTDWAIRRALWIRKAANGIRPHYCKICARQVYCRRLFANERIIMMVMKGEYCPDAYLLWDEIF